MSVIIKGMEAPKTCSDCWFMTEPNERPRGEGLYERVYNCYLNPKADQDDWKNHKWMSNNKHIWCPIREV